ncbi:N-acetylmuramoyl-L-alanine amidase CwlA [Cytobacillus horneckiae]|uniref:N-acetylmuramoyl-L-alanine amidase n=1 Tax=Cytobacillus horneckiae TaxID=549687 RepID=UPI0019D21042|nr:N-acetylmuramoyl-L-alanine amidase [Cytobacillus horneckiae]MBN6890056.1 N-acetylmuramoyl-L-alanine amidase [Cytobacillus horneckiae]
MVNIKKQLVSQEVINKKSFGKGNKKKYVTVHQTANTNPGANAQAHANLQSNMNSRDASWHYQADDKVIIQSFDDDIMCWAATDGRGPGNTESIHIELCINSDGDYAKTIDNGATLVRHLLDKYNLDISRVKQHRDWYNKDCPAQLRAGYKGITWTDFLNKVEGVQEKENFGSSGSSSNSKPAAKDTNSIVDYLKSKGIDSSFSNREKLAKQHGINDYEGSEEQNTLLLKKLQSGAKPTEQSKPKPKPKKKYVQLPETSSSWRVYPTNKAPVKGNEKGFLNPKKFGGLEYEVLGNPQKDVYTIKTSDFGKVNIYAAKSTGAKIVSK